MNLRDKALDLWIARLARRSTLSDHDRATIRAFPGDLIDYPSGRDVVALREKTTHSCLIADGMVARFGQTRAGLRQLSAFYIAGDMADLHSAVVPVVSAPLQATGGAVVMKIPHEAILAAAEGSPRLARAFWRDCVVDAQVAAEWMLNNGRRAAPARVAHLLCELACRHALIGVDRDDFPLALTQQHIADATGLTPVHVNRSLRRIREAGAIELRDRHVRVLDWDVARRLADFDATYLHLEHVDEPVLEPA